MIIKNALIACCKSKLHTGGAAVPAWQLYTGHLFVAQLAYARRVLRLEDKHIFILSAKHGLIRSLREIEPYECALIEMDAAGREQWKNRVRFQIQIQFKLHMQFFTFDPPELHFTILAGEDYRDLITPLLEAAGYRWQNPMPAGFGYGRQVQWLTEQIKRTA